MRMREWLRRGFRFVAHLKIPSDFFLDRVDSRNTKLIFEKTITPRKFMALWLVQSSRVVLSHYT
jgi:hypothetical protein